LSIYAEIYTFFVFSRDFAMGNATLGEEESQKKGRGLEENIWTVCHKKGKRL
jgi:hypothetical protein